jgi:glycosyltransferase involved in cell wall biosynthesis
LERFFRGFSKNFKPRGLIEPMAMGKPVITTDNKHCSGAVIDGYNGLIVPIKDSIALDSSIEKIVNDETLAEKFGQRSREKNPRRFR